ncbi:hypothetical protein MBELCI_1547 [Limimaricola cinnabarinus LL-001]|uniref:Uncharacterized protein n=1 Tax=Limimaricola cinnabarinus LL-001 TaxID=1337093 RepID=U2Z292_9RHOB|nr:hypothetical protein MBELCI_1547 [Limimaricola cinnabarinus LL-001]
MGLTAWELTRSDPVSRSVGLIDGRPRTSSAQRSRRLVTAQVAGIGPDLAGAGYVEMLKDLLAGGANLVRMDCRSVGWHLVPSLGLQNGVMDWREGAVELVWQAEDGAVMWADGRGMHGAPVVFRGWSALRVEGLPGGMTVARPGDLISITDGAATERSRVMAVTRSDAVGVATIRTRDAFTLSGLVSIGGTESIVFEVAGDMPRAVQPVSANWSYDFSLREVFADEYPDGWTERDPWH